MKNLEIDGSPLDVIRLTIGALYMNNHEARHYFFDDAAPVPTEVEKALPQLIKALKDAPLVVEFVCAPTGAEVTRVDARPIEARAPAMVIATLHSGQKEHKKPEEQAKGNAQQEGQAFGLLAELLKQKDGARSMDKNRKAQRREKKAKNFRDIEHEITVRETGAPGRVCLPQIQELNVSEMINEGEQFFDGYCTDFALRAHNQWMRKKETQTAFASLTYYANERSSEYLLRTGEEIQEELDKASQGNPHIRDTLEANAERIAFECRDRARIYLQMKKYFKEHLDQKSSVSEENKLKAVWESEAAVSTTLKAYQTVAKMTVSQWQEELAKKGTTQQVYASVVANTLYPGRGEKMRSEANTAQRRCRFSHTVEA
eukprot:gene8968-64735_t